jgi:hypothetical protein
MPKKRPAVEAPPIEKNPAFELRSVRGVYCVGFLFVAIRGWENKYGQRSINSLTVEFEASHEQNA